VCPPPQYLPVLEKIRSAYKMWQNFVPVIPKFTRYTIGETVDKYFLQVIENILIASFLQKQEKQPFIRKAIISLDTLKFFLCTIWETKNLDDKKYISLSLILNESGKMLGGWHGQIIKQTEKQNPALFKNQKSAGK
jgi:hypothetical protein